MNNINEKEFKPYDAREYLKNATDSIVNSQNKIISNAVKSKVSTLKEELKNIPKIYNKMKDNLTLSNGKQLKKLKEDIANTGNHTAGGYAISKRLDNMNEYNKGLREIDEKREEHKSKIEGEIERAYFDAEAEMARNKTDILKNTLKETLNEGRRLDDLNLEYLKFNEQKNNNARKAYLDERDDLRKQGSYEVEMKYKPQMYEQELIERGLKNEQIQVQTQNLIKSGQASSSNKGQSSKSGSTSGTKNDDVLSKMSSKDIAESIKNQIGSVHYDSYGNRTIKFSTDEAFKLLRSWQHKYNISDYIINDAAIYLGIQDYM
ncbi:MAG: hypothetical protein IKZ35_05310 [Clostridia bacterium]|nr:hypothetical protein [Clostridia bacterium]